MLHYFCKVHLYVVLNDFRSYISAHDGKADKYLSIMLLLGSIGYISGKIILGIFIDSYFKSALKAILITFILSPIFSTLFALSSSFQNETVRVSIFYVLWFVIHFVIASAWIGLVKLVSNWIPPSYHGRVMAICNLTWLFGDAVSRSIIEFVYDYFNNDWHSVFYFSSIVSAIAIIPTMLFIRDSPTNRGLPAVDDTKDNVYAKLTRTKARVARFGDDHIRKYGYDHDNEKYLRAGDSDTESNASSTRQPLSILSSPFESETSIMTLASPSNMYDPHNPERLGFCLLCKPLLKEPMFWNVLIMNFLYLFMMTLYKICFLRYLSDEVGLRKSRASTISLIVPFVGSISVIIAGIWLDKVKSKHWRLSIIPIFAAMTMMVLGGLAFFDPKDLRMKYVLILAVTFGLSVYGPYSLMTGVLAIDIGGQVSAGMVSGFTSAVGYLAVVIVGIIFDKDNISLREYKMMWMIGSGCCGGIVLIGIILFIYNRRAWLKNNPSYRSIKGGEEKQSLMEGLYGSYPAP